MSGPRVGALVSAGLLIGVAAQSLIQDGFGLERWQAFEAAHWSPAARTVPQAIAILIFAVVLAARSGRPKVHRAGSWAPRHCPSCGASIPTASPEIAGNLFMVFGEPDIEIRRVDPQMTRMSADKSNSKKHLRTSAKSADTPLRIYAGTHSRPKVSATAAFVTLPAFTFICRLSGDSFLCFL